MRSVTELMLAVTLATVVISGAHAEEIPDVTRITPTCCMNMAHKMCRIFEHDPKFVRFCREEAIKKCDERKPGVTF